MRVELNVARAPSICRIPAIEARNLEHEHGRPQTPHQRRKHKQQKSEHNQVPTIWIYASDTASQSTTLNLRTAMEATGWTAGSCQSPLRHGSKQAADVVTGDPTNHMSHVPNFLPRGSKYPIFKDSGPKTMPLIMVLGTRDLKRWVHCRRNRRTKQRWVLGPSGLYTAWQSFK